MIKQEKNYEFRKRFMQMHKKNLRDWNAQIKNDEIEIMSGFIVDISKTDSDVVLTAAKDFQDYMLISMNVSIMIERTSKKISKNRIHVEIVGSNKTLGLANGYMGYKLSIKEDITIMAYDERGVAQAFYYLEDIMTMRKAPYLKKGETKRKAMFTPRMVHSGYGIDQYPDYHLRSIAHAGMDAILVFTKGPNITTYGFLDFNELILRAEKYGIDVYAYSYIKSEVHPEDSGAESYYESTYGKLFENCPKLKGVVLVGESVAFPSEDPHTSGKINSFSADNIPENKIHPGFWPCQDYPQWLNLIKKVIRKYNRNADIVFWTYNWGWAPKKERERLIYSLPEDISLLVTYEMHEVYEKSGVTERSADYTLSLVGPGKYFLSEAAAAKEKGIRLYAMTNTAGLTWDFGTIPYEPFPYQWKNRYDSILKCREKYNLCGLMESHHYGFYPSFVSEFAKQTFTLTDLNGEIGLQDIIISFFGGKDYEMVDEALKYWSEAIEYYIAVDADQYGPFRIGPAYPLCLEQEIMPVAAEYAHFGTDILRPKYIGLGRTGHSEISMPQIRMPHEIKNYEKMDEKISKGISILEKINVRNEELERLLNLGKYINCCVKTAVNTKKFALASAQLTAAVDIYEMEQLVNRIESIAVAEIENARTAIPLVQADSRLGWEPSMEYLGDAEHIEWKIKQVKYMLDVELTEYKNALKKNM